MHDVYEALIPPYRNIVDRLVVETWNADWRTRRHYLTSVYDALYRNRDKVPDMVPERTLSFLVAGLIERLDSPPIEDRMQAAIYAVSADPNHRAASGYWFDRHPAEHAAIQDEIETGSRLH